MEVPVRLAATLVPFFFDEEDNNRFSGIMSPFCDVLINKMNRSVTVTLTDNIMQIGKITSPTNGTGLLGIMMRNESDLSVSPLPVTEQLFKYFEATRPVLHVSWTFFSTPQVGKSVMFSVFYVFEMSVWIPLLITLLSLPIIWTIVKKLTSKVRFLASLNVNSFNTVAALLEQGPPFDTGVRSSLSAKLMFGAVFLGCFILSASYKSLLLSWVTVPELPIAIDTWKDLRQFPKMKVYVLTESGADQFIKGSSNADVMAASKVTTVIHDAVEMMSMVESPPPDGMATFFMPIYLGLVMHLSGLCEDEPLNAFFGSKEMVLEPFSYFFRRDLESSLKRVILKSASMYIESGLEGYELRKAAIPSQGCLDQYFIKSDVEGLESLSLKNFRACLMVFAIGCLVSIATIVKEMIFTPV